MKNWVPPWETQCISSGVPGCADGSVLLWFTPPLAPAEVRQTKPSRWTGSAAKCSLTWRWAVRFLAALDHTTKAKCSLPRLSQTGNGSHPQLMNILSLDDKLRRQNVCQVVIKSSPTERCRVLPVDVGNVNSLCCGAVKQTKSRATAVSGCGAH